MPRMAPAAMTKPLVLGWMLMALDELASRCDGRGLHSQI